MTRNGRVVVSKRYRGGVNPLERRVSNPNPGGCRETLGMTSDDRRNRVRVVVGAGHWGGMNPSNAGLVEERKVKERGSRRKNFGEVERPDGGFRGRGNPEGGQTG